MTLLHLFEAIKPGRYFSFLSFRELAQNPYDNPQACCEMAEKQEEYQEEEQPYHALVDLDVLVKAVGLRIVRYGVVDAVESGDPDHLGKTS